MVKSNFLLCLVFGLSGAEASRLRSPTRRSLQTGAADVFTEGVPHARNKVNVEARKKGHDGKNYWTSKDEVLHRPAKGYQYSKADNSSESKVKATAKSYTAKGASEDAPGKGFSNKELVNKGGSTKEAVEKGSMTKESVGEETMTKAKSITSKSSKATPVSTKPSKEKSVSSKPSKAKSVSSKSSVEYDYSSDDYGKKDKESQQGQSKSGTKMTTSQDFNKNNVKKTAKVSTNTKGSKDTTKNSNNTKGSKNPTSADQKSSQKSGTSKTQGKETYSDKKDSNSYAYDDEPSKHQSSKYQTSSDTQTAYQTLSQPAESSASDLTPSVSIISVESRFGLEFQLESDALPTSSDFEEIDVVVHEYLKEYIELTYNADPMIRFSKISIETTARRIVSVPFIDFTASIFFEGSSPMIPTGKQIADKISEGLSGSNFQSFTFAISTQNRLSQSNPFLSVNKITVYIPDPNTTMGGRVASPKLSAATMAAAASAGALTLLLGGYMLSQGGKEQTKPVGKHMKIMSRMTVADTCGASTIAEENLTIYGEDEGQYGMDEPPYDENYISPPPTKSVEYIQQTPQYQHIHTTQTTFNTSGVDTGKVQREKSRSGVLITGDSHETAPKEDINTMNGRSCSADAISKISPPDTRIIKGEIELNLNPHKSETHDEPLKQSIMDNTTLMHIEPKHSESNPHWHEAVDMNFPTSEVAQKTCISSVLVPFDTGNNAAKGKSNTSSFLSDDKMQLVPYASTDCGINKSLPLPSPTTDGEESLQIVPYASLEAADSARAFSNAQTSGRASFSEKDKPMTLSIEREFSRNEASTSNNGSEEESESQGDGSERSTPPKVFEEVQL